MRLSVDEITEILAESFEQHKNLYRDNEELVSSCLKEVKRLCKRYKVNYDERTVYQVIKHFYETSDLTPQSRKDYQSLRRYNSIA